MIRHHRGWTLHRGHVFHVKGSPPLSDAARHLVEIPDGAVLVDPDGRIHTVGGRDELPEAPPEVLTLDHPGCFLLPGFVDTHVHFPQVYARDLHGGGALLGWLERCVFPYEARLSDPRHAQCAARDFCEALTRAGTTTALVFGSQFPDAQAALVDELARRGMRAVLGRTAMVTGPPAAAPLLTSEEDAVRLARDEIAAWHRPEELLQVALVPRFALSMTRRALALFGELWEEHKGSGVYVTTHLSENAAPAGGEVGLVRSTFGVPSYIDVYDGRFLEGAAVGGPSLLGRRTVMAHAVHCTDAELARLRAAGAGVAHCPTSQLFLGSGTLPWRRTAASGVRLGLGSDVGAGDTFSIAEVANACYKVHVSEPGDAAALLHPAELLHLATLGGAQVLDLADRVGNLDPGKEADLVVIDPGRRPPLGRALELLGDAEPSARLFTLLLGMGGECVAETWVRGRRVGATG